MPAEGNLPRVPPAKRQFPFVHTLEIEYSSVRHADIVSRSLSVDAELHAESVRSSFRSDHDRVFIYIEAKDARLLRLKTNALYENLYLATCLLEQFDL